MKKSPWEIVDALTQNPEWIDTPDYDLRKIGENIEPVDWFFLLMEQPQFECYFDWRKCRKYTNLPWARLLEKQPQFAEKCPWKHVDRLELVSMYFCCPEIVKAKFPDGVVLALSKFLTGTEISLLLGDLPQAEFLFDWQKIKDKISDADWLYLLSKQPQFECYFDWNRVKNKKTFFWEKLLIRQPQFAKYCNYEMLYDYQIRKIRRDVEKMKNEQQQTTCELAQHLETYHLPSVQMLNQHNDAVLLEKDFLERNRNLIQQILADFWVEGKVDRITAGPRIIQYQISLNKRVKDSKIARLCDHIAMRMNVQSVRIVPIPGLNAVGVEVPRENPGIVGIRSVMESEAWTQNKGAIPIVLGRDVAGNAVVPDLAKAPHMLIAGTTGSGKSVCMDTLITSLLFKFSPEELQFLLIDPKVVEMAAYQTIPHLITPVVNDPEKVLPALRWSVNEMERRYRQMAKVSAWDLESFNERPKSAGSVYDEEGKEIPDHLPRLIIIINELVDMMLMENRSDVEICIGRIAAKGRAAGIHLVIATQAPRKDVITGLIKTLLPARIAFKVGTNRDSRVILDQDGAEKLLGMGDALFMPLGSETPQRIQTALVTYQEIERIVKFCSQQAEQHFNAEVLAEDMDFNAEVPTEAVDSIAEKYLHPDDPYLLYRALKLIINERNASTSFLQRRLEISYNSAAELMEKLERRNIVSKPYKNGQKRDILILDTEKNCD